MWNWQNTQWIAACAFVLLASAPAQALIISKSNTNQVVVGAPQGPDTFTQSVVFNPADFSGAANDEIQSLTVDIEFIKCGEAFSTPLPSGCSDQTSADNASVSQIGFSLTEPDHDPLEPPIYLVFPSSISFSTYNDTDPGGRIHVTFDDSATFPDLTPKIVGHWSGLDPSFISGTFAPEEVLSLFNGKHATGIWNLAITNAGAGAPLGVASFTVNLNVNEKQGTGTDVPEPDTLALLGLGLAGVLAFRRRSAS